MPIYTHIRHKYPQGYAYGSLFDLSRAIIAGVEFDLKTTPDAFGVLRTWPRTTLTPRKRRPTSQERLLFSPVSRVRACRALPRSAARAAGEKDTVGTGEFHASGHLLTTGAEAQRVNRCELFAARAQWTFSTESRPYRVARVVVFRHCNEGQVLSGCRPSW